MGQMIVEMVMILGPGESQVGFCSVPEHSVSYREYFRYLERMHYGRTDQWTDKASYRDARTHLKGKLERRFNLRFNHVSTT